MFERSEPDRIAEKQRGAGSAAQRSLHRDDPPCDLLDARSIGMVDEATQHRFGFVEHRAEPWEIRTWEVRRRVVDGAGRGSTAHDGDDSAHRTSSPGASGRQVYGALSP